MHRLLLALVLLPSTAVAQISGPAQPMQLGGQPQAPTAEDCKIIKFSGDTMDCAGGTCVIAGGAELRCATTRLNAYVVEVDYDENNNFMGARASGNVLYVRGRHVMRCNALTVGQDHIQGRVDDAIFNVKLVPPDLSKPGVPPGRNVATFNGDIERTTEQDYKVYGGDFTLCDCGLEPPSWRFTAKEIDAHLGQRATLWWPVFRLRPFSLFELPIPMAPISMPLSRRAFGILPPNPRFLGGRPLIDLPVFIPIGDSVDLTVIPGTRMDWAPPLKLDPSTWGAPRLGGRVRYAATDTWFGEFAVDYTHDGGNWRSKNAADTVRRLSPTATEEQIAANPDVRGSSRLSERVSLNGFQRATVAPNLDWSANVSWISDDAVLRDFAANIRDAASNYLPSRTELLFRPDGFSALASVDYFVLTNNSSAFDYSNTRGLERNTMHRLPFLRVAMEPLPLVNHLTVDADASFVRYGRLGASNPAHAENQPIDALNVGNLVGGVSYADRLGYFNIHARAATDALFTASDGDNHSINSLILSAKVDTRLSRSYSKLTHTITPRVEYRSVPTQSGNLPTFESLAPQAPDTPRPTVLYDARLQRRTFHQAMVSVDQAFWIKGPLSALPILNLSLRQPFDLENGQVLQTQAEVQWRAPQYLTGTGRVSIAVGQDEPLREVSATTQLWLRYLTLGLGYARWQVNADRFVRSLYELAAPRDDGTSTSLRPIHTLSGSASTTIRRVTLSYSTDYLMPLRREQLPTQVERSDPNDPYFGRPITELPENRRSFVEHRGSIVYRSPCNCWGVSAMFAFPNNEFWWDNKRINILFDIGGYSLGNNR